MIPYCPLKHRQDFLRLTKQGHKIAMPTFVLQVLLRPSQNEDAFLVPRVGFTASKKIGNAVMRNRAKRRLKAAAASYLNAHPLTCLLPLDFVLIARSTTPTVLFSQIILDLKKAFSKMYTTYIPTLSPLTS